MQKRWFRQILALMIVLVLAAGCSGKDSSDKWKSDAGENQETTKEQDPKKLLDDAMAKLEKETLKAAETKNVTCYSDGINEEEYYTTILDTEKNIIERISKDHDETIYHCFNVKEKDGSSVYVKDDLSGNEWIRYPEEVESEEFSEYQYWLSEFVPVYTEENGYQNLKYYYEGEEELSGEKAFRVRVIADQVYNSGVENAEEITRKSVLKEKGWTEKEVALVDGFSEILDAYVEASNQEDNDTVKCALTAWIRKDDHSLLKTRSAVNMESTKNTSVKDAINTFNEESWKVDMIQQNLEVGLTEKEAKKLLEDDLKAMENPKEEDIVDADDESGEAGEEFDGAAAEDYSDESAEVTKIIVTKKIMTGKDAPAMSELPKKYKDVTQSEYFGGGMDLFQEDDYFSDDETEFEDEFE